MSVELRHIEQPQVLTPEEAAVALRVTPQCVREQLASGKIPGFRVGRLWRIPADQFAAYLRGEWTAAEPQQLDNIRPLRRVR